MHCRPAKVSLSKVLRTVVGDCLSCFSRRNVRLGGGQRRESHEGTNDKRAQEIKMKIGGGIAPGRIRNSDVA